MIQKQRRLFYFVGDEAFVSLEEAQKCDLKKLMPENGGGVPASTDLLSDWLIENKTAIVDVLTTSPTSRLNGRKLHGATRKKKVKVIGAEPAKPVPSTGTNRQP
jgi:hypothetical protein